MASWLAHLLELYSAAMARGLPYTGKEESILQEVFLVEDVL